jgi:hypothetical protein
MIFPRKMTEVFIRGYSKPSNIGMVNGAGSNGTANQAYGVGLFGVKVLILYLKRRKKIKTNS